MVNLKYPPGLKQKGPMAWLGAICIGWGPLFFFWEEALSLESKNGVNHRSVSSEQQYWFALNNVNFKHTIQTRELLDFNPNYKISDIDKKRLRFDSLGLETTIY